MEPVFKPDVTVKVIAGELVDPASVALPHVERAWNEFCSVIDVDVKHFNKL